MHRAPRALCTAASTAALALVGALSGACAVRPAADTGLNKDLALAEQLQRLNAPALVVPRDSTAAAAPSPAAPQLASAHVAPTRVVTHTVVRTRGASTGEVRTAVAARPRADVPAGSQVSSPPRAQPGASDVGRVSGGEVADVGPSAPADGSVAQATRTVPGAYGVEQPAGRRPQAHAARDGVLAAVAGAIIGAAASPHDRVRGGVVGAVAGGALGAVYGSTADRTYRGYEPPSYRTYTGLRRYPTYRSGY